MILKLTNKFKYDKNILRSEFFHYVKVNYFAPYIKYVGTYASMSPQKSRTFLSVSGLVTERIGICRNKI